MFLLTVGVLLFVLYHRGSLGPFRWVGSRPAMAGPGRLAAPVESAESVLARRLADGEIDPDEYLERAALLKDR